VSGRKTNERKIFELVKPLADALDLALLEVRYVHENGRTILRLIIDKRGGVGIDDCERLSEEADPLIAETLRLTDYEVFEVSSPGLDRPLKTIEDCERHEGEWARVSLYRAVDGDKKFIGSLAVEDDCVGVITEDGERHLFPWKDVAAVKREIVF
jgi:ribosome maturation factor RimP